MHANTPSYATTPEDYIVGVQPYGLQPARFLCPWDSPGKILEWAAMPSSRGSSQPRDQTWISCLPALAGKFSTTSATWEVPLRYGVDILIVTKFLLQFSIAYTYLYICTSLFFFWTRNLNLIIFHIQKLKNPMGLIFISWSVCQILECST